MILRDYQLRDLESVRRAMRVHRSVLLVQPTGAGKGTLASHIVQSASAKGKSILFLVNRRTLVHDMCQRLERLGIAHGVIMGSDPRRKPWLSVHVASIDTLHRRAIVPKADLLIIDEAHFCVSDTWRKVIDRYPDAKVLGMTATPIRVDRRGLGEMFTAMVSGPSVQELIDLKFLVPSRTFAPASPDLSGVKSTGGDYNQKALAEMCDKAKLVGDIVAHWKRLSSERKTACFGVNQAHAQHIAEQFRCEGVDFAYVDAETPDDERDRIWKDLDYGRLPGISSVGVISYGWDHPIVSTIIQARPTESVGLHLQQIGRGSRPHPGKDELIVLDHAGNTHRHGFYEDPREWSLDGRALTEPKDSEPTATTCRQCFGVFRTGPVACPYCGAVIERQERAIETVKGDLTELLPRMVCDGCKREMPGAKAGDACVPHDGLMPYGACPGEARRAFQIKQLSKHPKIAELQRIAEARGYKPGWLGYQLGRLGLRREA